MENEECPAGQEIDNGEGRAGAKAENGESRAWPGRKPKKPAKGRDETSWRRAGRLGMSACSKKHYRAAVATAASILGDYYL